MDSRVRTRSAAPVGARSRAVGFACGQPSNKAIARQRSHGAACWSTRDSGRAVTCFAYVFACTWEDHCKVGFSRDPLQRIAQLHARWFEHFDLEHGFLVEVEREREARDLELRLRRPLALHRAPRPLTVNEAAGGHTEWLRGAIGALEAEAVALVQEGHVVHAPIAGWLRQALSERAWQLHDAAEAQLGPATDRIVDTAGDRTAVPVSRRGLRDALDGYVALGVDVQAWLSPRAWAWHCAGNRPER